ncbi:hypothetical protein BX666DRAFT_2025615 [Dichotomocladium elegans]|nr:hypothetical protein BX666DRAFT_2025615 [Dichotomocladium elegans]
MRSIRRHIFDSPERKQAQRLHLQQQYLPSNIIHRLTTFSRIFRGIILCSMLFFRTTYGIEEYTHSIEYLSNHPTFRKTYDFIRSHGKYKLLNKIASLVADEDILPVAILGFPLSREELIEFGGPGRVMDNFLDRGVRDPVTLSALVPHIPAECAIVKGVTRMDRMLVEEIGRVWSMDSIFSTGGYIMALKLGWTWGLENIGHDLSWDYDILLMEYYVKTKQWEKLDNDKIGKMSLETMIMLPTDLREHLHKYHRLFLAIRECPEEQLDDLIREFEKLRDCFRYMMMDLTKYDTPERAIDFARRAKLCEDAMKEAFLETRCMDGCRLLGTLSVDELDAYEMAMDPDRNLIDDVSPEARNIYNDLCTQFYKLLYTSGVG